VFLNGSTAPGRRHSPAAPVVACLLLLGGAQRVTADPPSSLVLEDAERFAGLLAGSSLPSAATLETGYLRPGTPGIQIFVPHRIESATNLARAISEDPAAYRKAVSLRLPVATRMQHETSRLIARVGEILGQDDLAPAYVVFGAGNSGGTADEGGLVLGLEVICRQAETNAEAAQVLEDFIAHEMTHVYQARVGGSGYEDDLLRQALVEGFAGYQGGALG
jgi:hypothetical protein